MARHTLIAVVATVAALAVAIVLVVGSDESGEEGGPGPAFFGANAPLLRDYTTPDRLPVLRAHARVMAELGLGRARIVFGQEVEQRARGAATDWSVPDAVVGALAAEGIRTDALITGTAAWAAAPDAAFCGARAPPADVAAWARFAGEAATRYGSKGTFWREHPELERLPVETFEIGNEPNLALFWCPAADPEQYAAVLDAAATRVSAADPEATVAVGGLATLFDQAPEGDVAFEEFLRRMLATRPGLRERIDAVAIHPYGRTPSDILDAVASSRAALYAVGLGGTPLIANEVGWYTQGPSGPLLAPEGTRAALTAEVASVIDESDCGVEGFSVHAWLTAEQDPGNPSDWYGIADPESGEPRESASRYGDAIRGEGSGALAGLASTLCG